MNAPNLWLHVKILYFCVVLVTAATGFGLWMCFTEFSNVRKEIDNGFMHRGAVEFGNVEHVYGSEERRGPSGRKAGGGGRGDGAGPGGEAEEDGPAGGLAAGLPSHTSPADSPKAGEEDELIRVKRRAGRRRQTNPGTFLTSKAWNKEGSATPEDWVWLTSYSRIPVSTDSPPAT